MISRNGTRRSGAASGVAKIFRDEGRGPVVTAGRVVSGLERMFIVILRFNSLAALQRDPAPVILEAGIGVPAARAQDG